jgi:hypothetical protein
MGAVRDARELGGDAEPVARLSDAPLQHRRDIQLRPDAAHVERLALERERRGARHHPQVRNAGEGVDQLLGEAVAEILLVFFGTEVEKREHDHR